MLNTIQRICSSILSFVQNIDRNIKDIKQKVNNIYSYVCPQDIDDGKYSYELVDSIALTDGIRDKLIPPDCKEDEHFDPYCFKSDFEYRPGDIIRRYDDTFHMMMVRVIQRIFANGKIYLVCRRLDPQKEFIFKQAYANECIRYMEEHPDEFIKGEEPAWLSIQLMIDELTAHCTTVDTSNICYRTKEIVYGELGLEYHRPCRYEYDTF